MTRSGSLPCLVQWPFADAPCPSPPTTSLAPKGAQKKSPRSTRRLGGVSAGSASSVHGAVCMGVTLRPPGRWNVTSERCPPVSVTASETASVAIG